MQSFLPHPLSGLLFLSLFSCSSTKHNAPAPPQEKIIAAHAKKQKDHHLALVRGNRPMLDDNKRLSLYYRTKQSLKLPEVRELFVASVEELIDLAKAESEWETDDENQNFSIQHLDFLIGFMTEEARFFDPPSIAYAFLDQETICYCYYDRLFGTFTEYKDVKEPYAKALMLVREKEQNASENTR
ncbi:MAG: hypothetical protein WB791_11270 [Waddliaceae bacterium]